MSDSPAAPPVAVIGGGLAGLAAALRLNEHGCAVQLFEARRQLGGRAASFRDPATGELIDYCQHVSMGCCTNLADFAARTGIERQFERFTHLNVVASRRQYRLAASRWLPAPAHLLPAFMELGYLSLPNRLQTIRLLMQLARTRADGGSNGGTDSMACWLTARGASASAITGFWNVILISALGESVDRVSVAAARKVLVEGFMANRRAYEVLVPRRPLSEILDRQVGAVLSDRGVQITRGSTVESLSSDRSGKLHFCSRDGQHSFDAVVFAVSWRHAGKIVSTELSVSLPDLQQAAKIESAPITGVHLWFDRAITHLPHCILIGRLSQWIFARPTAERDSADSTGHYYQVVVSGSHELAGRSNSDIVSEVQSDLTLAFPEAQGAKLLHARVVTDPHAVFSSNAQVQRPPQKTTITGLFLAGDWTNTGWPATMEGAVRSGYRAAEGVLHQFGRPASLLESDLPRSWLARMICRK
jgi:squalene-associated FAD-dependent desaturase